MARRRLIAGIAFAGLGWGLLIAHSQGFSQNTPDARAERPAAVTENQPDARAETQAAIAKYCTTCHNERLKTAGLVLDPTAVARPGEQSETWEKVLRQLRAGTMPPPGAARPPQAFYTRAAGYLSRELEASAAARPNPGTMPLAHRLTRTEYANVMRDLLALPDLPKEFDYATLLPADNASSGFDNLADTLFVSPATMERYLAAALKISRVAVGDPDMGPLVNTHITPVRQTQDGRNEALPFGTRGGLQIDGYFPLDAEYEFKVETADAVADVHQLEISIDGERKAITNVSRRPGVPQAGDASNRGAFRFAVPAGPRSVGVAFVERSEALSEDPLRPPGRNRGALPSVVSVTITGPFNATGPGDTPSRRRLFVCRPSTRDARSGQGADAREESACADRILTTLLRRAYRRNVTADDLRRVRQFYEAGRAERDFDLGIQRALERVLVSPQFLFRIEQEPASAAPGSVHRVSDFELASRLSFFLWSSIPDEELLDAAAAGTLRQPDVLRRQVTRMLADSRSRSLVTNFAAQWLFLRDVETKEPDLYLFRDFDESVRAAFVRETELFLDSILRLDEPQRRRGTAAPDLDGGLYVPERTPGQALRHPADHRQPFPSRDAAQGESTRGVAGTRKHLVDHVLQHAHIGGIAGQVRARESAGLAAATTAGRCAVAQHRTVRETAVDEGRDAAAPRQSGVRRMPRQDGSDRLRAGELRRTRAVACRGERASARSHERAA